MRVVMLSTDRNIFSPESAVAKRMAEYSSLVEGLDIIVFTKKGFAPLQIAPNVMAYPTNSFSKFLYTRDAFRIGKKLPKADVITSQDPFEVGGVALRLGKLFGARVELQVHTDFLNYWYGRHSLLNRYRVHLARKHLPHATCVRVVSERIRRSMEEGGIRLKAHPRLAPIVIEKTAGEASLFLKEKYPQFTFFALVVSRLAPEKDTETAVRAFAKVVERYPKAGLIILGDGPEQSRLESLVRKLGIYSSVVFEGWQTNLSSYYGSADVLLVTSRYEGYGRMLIEAALHGLPSVTTNVGVVGEVVEDGTSALVCKVGDVACVSEKVGKLVGDNNLRVNLGVHAREAAQASLVSPGKYLEQMKHSWENCGI